MNRLLNNEPLHYGRGYAGPVETEFEIDTSKAAQYRRTAIPKNQFKGHNDFEEIERCIEPGDAKQEAWRCYSCREPFGKYRTCWFCLPCEVECPHDALWVEMPYLLR